MTDADYVDDLALLANTPPKAESLLHSLGETAEGINLNVNANKTESLCFKQEGTVFIFSGKSLKIIEQFTYLGNNISFTESDVNMHMGGGHLQLLRSYRTFGNLIYRIK